VRVPVSTSARPLRASEGSGRALPSWVPPSPVEPVPRFALGPENGATPWFELPADGRIGLFLTGERRPSDRLLLEWGRARTGGVVRLGAAAIRDDLGPMAGDTAWRFRTGDELPEPDEEANAIRVAFDPGVEPGGAVAVTSPVAYETQPLGERVRADGSTTLVWPNLFLYFPCVRQPVLRNGIVQPPTHVISWTNQWSPFSAHLTSPFEGVRDLYDLEQLSTADSAAPPQGVFAYEVQSEIPGATMVEPVATTVAQR
jgi:EmbC C-terminal domain